MSKVSCVRISVICLALAFGCSARAQAVIVPQEDAAAGQESPGVPQLVPPGGVEFVTASGETFAVSHTAKVRAYTTGQEGSFIIAPAAGQKFSMQLQFRADRAEGGELVTQEQMQAAITKSAERFAEDSQQGKPEFKPMKYGGRPGFYSVFTDKRLVGVDQPPDNDYRHAVVGVLRLSERSVLQFTLLVDDLASPDFFDALSYAMKFAKPPPATQPAGK